MENHSIVIPTKDKLFNLDPLLRRTPGNILTWIILTVGLIITIIRFTQGIGSVTNLDDNQPWGLWIGFDLLCGVCLAAGGYFTTVACYVMGMKHFHSAVRPAVTTAFLGYAFVVVALLYDLAIRCVCPTCSSSPAPPPCSLKWACAWPPTSRCSSSNSPWRPWNGWPRSSPG